MELTQKEYDKLIRYAKSYAKSIADTKYVKELEKEKYEISAKFGWFNEIKVLGDEE